MKSLVKILFFIFLTVLFSCKKENMCDCVKSTGEMKTEYRTLADFKEIELDDNINLTLTQDTVNFIEIEAGSHLLKLIKTDIRDNILYISNKNKCNWVRSFKKEINARLHYKDLYRLTYRGSGNINNTNTINSDIIYVESWDGSGVIDLTINSKESYIKEHIGPADLIIKGNTGYNFIWSAGYGKMDCSKLEANEVWVVSKGTNDTYLSVNTKLTAIIDYIGNIYYKGDPTYLKTDIEGSGKLIKN